MNHLPCGHVVQNHRSRIAIGDPIWDRKEVLGLTHEKFCKAFVNCERGHTLAQIKTSDASANRFNLAGDLIARHEGHLRRV
jgi:hypothetical protein